MRFKAFALLLLTLTESSALVFADRPKITRDVSYAGTNNLALSFDVAEPTEPNGAAVLYMISGGWYSHRFDPGTLFPETKREKNIFGKLADAGYTVFLVRHRSAPKFKVPEAVADVRTAVRYLRSHADEYHIDPDRFGAMGSSAGGHLSLMLGTADGPDDISPDRREVTGISDRVQAVVAYFAPSDLRPIQSVAKKHFPALDFDPSLAESVSPLAHVSPDDAPTLLVHGTNDRLVPLISSQAIHLAFKLKDVPARLVTLEGAGHGFRGDFEKRAADAAVGWFNERLAGTN